MTNKPQKICFHWTAGAYAPCNADLKAYHFLVGLNLIKDTKTGKTKEVAKIYNGNFKPEDNNICNPGKYAAHCGGGNTGTIGISVCSMFQFNNRDKKTPYPLTRVQIEAMCKAAAEQAIKYNIAITPANVYTHWEFGQKNPKTTSFGKIDIGFLPYKPELNPKEVADELRRTTNWYKEKIQKGLIK